MYMQCQIVHVHVNISQREGEREEESTVWTETAYACNTNNIHEAITSANPQAQTDIVGYINSGIFSIVRFITI